MKKIMKLINVCFMILYITISPCLNVFSASIVTDRFDFNQKGSITMTYISEELPLENIELELYQLSIFNANYTHNITNEFKDFREELENLSESNEVVEFVNKMQNYINTEMLTPFAKQKTDIKGKAEFKNLQPGIYFIQSEVIINGNDEIYTEPSLIIVGSYDKENKEWVYDFTGEPKVDIVTTTDVISVKKVWKDVNTSLLIPPFITIELYCDGELYDTVDLSNDNDWKHTWENIDKSKRWAIKETTELKDFEVSYTNELMQFTVTNTYKKPSPTPTPPTTTPPTEEEELPDTGSHAFLISVLASIGVIFLLLGVLLKSKR